MEERELLFDDLSVGQEFPTSTFEISEEVVTSYAEAIGDTTVRIVEIASDDGSAVRRIVAHPTIAGIFTRPGRLLPSHLRMPPGSIQAEQSYEFMSPIVAGDTMYTAARVAEKYIRKERKYVVMTISTVNQRGETVLRGLLVGIWGK